MIVGGRAVTVEEAVGGGGVAEFVFEGKIVLLGVMVKVFVGLGVGLAVIVVVLVWVKKGVGDIKVAVGRSSSVASHGGTSVVRVTGRQILGSWLLGSKPYAERQVLSREWRALTG